MATVLPPCQSAVRRTSWRASEVKACKQFRPIADSPKKIIVIKLRGHARGHLGTSPPGNMFRDSRLVVTLEACKRHHFAKPQESYVSNGPIEGYLRTLGKSSPPIGLGRCLLPSGRALVRCCPLRLGYCKTRYLSAATAAQANGVRRSALGARRSALADACSS